MSLLSRFRKTVTSGGKSKSNNNSNSSNNKNASATERNYQRSTKSSAVKSLKAKFENNDDGRNDRIVNGSKPIAIDYSRGEPLLRRSSTFTLEDEEIENVPEHRYNRHDGDRRGDVSSNDEYHHRNNDFNSYGHSRGKLD